ncbi:hypothetical protein, partial [Ruegeria aquimaris]|nr:hypothetical protein [Ruegeria sp. XHP0148]
GTSETIANLAVGESTTISTSYAITQDDIDNNGGGDGDIDNTATADSTETDPVEDSEDVPVVQNPAIEIDKQTILFTTDGEIDEIGDDLQGALPGDEVTWMYTVTNSGNITIDGDSIVIVDDNGTPFDPTDDFDNTGLTSPNIVGVDEDGNNFNDGDTNENGELDVGESWVYVAEPKSVVPSGIFSYRNIAEVNATAVNDAPVSDSDDSGYFVLNAGYVTDSSFCTFGGTFNVMFSPDMYGTYTQNSTQPGQYFYNFFGDFQDLFADGSDDPNVLTLHIPDGFALQSPDAFFENAVHVYTDLADPVLSETQDICFGFEQATEVSRDEYEVSYVYSEDGSFDVVITFDDDNSAHGLFAANVHLDFETEDSSGWQMLDNDAVNGPGPGANLANDVDIYASDQILDGTEYIFYATTGADGVDVVSTSEDSVYNDNDFKKYSGKGFGGFVWDDENGDGDLDDGEGVGGATLELFKWENGSWVHRETMITDEDGWYNSVYTHKGKASDYRIELLDEVGDLYADEDGIQLGKGHHFEMVNFEVEADDFDGI